MRRSFCSVLLSCLFVVSINVCGQEIKQEIKPGASPAWAVGNANAAASIEVFNDYQCPPCGKFNEQLQKIRAKHKDDVQVIFRNFPLTPTHPNAHLAAQSAEAAGLQGKFVEMIDELYDHARAWAEADNPRPFFMSYARKLNLDLSRFGLDFDSDLVRERIRLDVERARSLEVQGTPTVFLNGKRVEVQLTLDMLPVVDRALKNPKP